MVYSTSWSWFLKTYDCLTMQCLDIVYAESVSWKISKELVQSNALKAKTKEPLNNTPPHPPRIAYIERLASWACIETMKQFFLMHVPLFLLCLYGLFLKISKRGWAFNIFPIFWYKGLLFKEINILLKLRQPSSLLKIF